MTDWNPALYRQFEDQRTRPARDLLARVTLADPTEIVDLGCGPGNSTELLTARFPKARVTGIDTSEAMLKSARARLPAAFFARVDIGNWAPDRPVDCVYANASLQWLPDHQILLPRLFGFLAPGGMLAVQMPDNLAEPSHRAMRETAVAGLWRDRIGEAGAARAKTMLSMPDYYDLLSPIAVEVDVWRTEYQHPMSDPDAIVNWLRSTGLRPFIDPLSETDRVSFIDAYRAKIDEAYPVRADGLRLFAFPRLFIVARART